jgi:hypothetical protein
MGLAKVFGGVERVERTLMLWRRMLRTGWYSAVHVKSEDLLWARDQLMRGARQPGARGCYDRSASGWRRARAQEVRRGAMLYASVTAPMGLGVGA